VPSTFSKSCGWTAWAVLLGKRARLAINLSL
jgi:hypothetical protein